MATVTLDILPNSSSRLGDGYSSSHSKRRVLVEGLTSGDLTVKENQAKQAILTAIGGAGSTHPVYTWMPLAYIEGGMIGTTKYMGNVVYRTRTFRFFPSPGVLKARAVETTWETLWYDTPGDTTNPTFDAFGRPNGPPEEDDDGNFKSRILVWRAIKFFVPFRLLTAPNVSLGDLMGTTNTQTIPQGSGPLGWGFATGALRFDGMSRVDETFNQGVTEYTGWYVFTAQRGLFAEQYVENGEVKTGFRYPGGWSGMATFPTS